MEMRENILKEREQLLEVEKMKAQQNTEINQIKAVHQQLGNMVSPSPHTEDSILNLQTQTNLNHYIQE